MTNARANPLEGWGGGSTKYSISSYFTRSGDFFFFWGWGGPLCFYWLVFFFLRLRAFRVGALERRVAAANPSPSFFFVCVCRCG